MTLQFTGAEIWVPIRRVTMLTRCVTMVARHVMTSAWPGTPGVGLGGDRAEPIPGRGTREPGWAAAGPSRYPGGDPRGRAGRVRRARLHRGHGPAGGPARPRRPRARLPLLRRQARAVRGLPRPAGRPARGPDPGPGRRARRRPHRRPV